LQWAQRLRLVRRREAAMPGTPDYMNPPIVELAISAQFSPLTKLSAGHFGLLWKELGADWTDPADAPPIEDQYELFDRPRAQGLRLQLRPIHLPLRFTIGHKCKDRLVQIQASRFCLNWRKRNQTYPTYKKLIGEFEGLFTRFEEFAKRQGLDPVEVNQWELTYIDAFPKGEEWENETDWGRILPGLFGNLFSTEGLNLTLVHRAAEWSYEIGTKRGRLHLSAALGQVQGDKRDALLLTTTARGPVGASGTKTLRAGLDLGHDAAYAAFDRIVSAATKKRWEKEP
jgi:uncharacterized protein (TIGR04255 family)